MVEIKVILLNPHKEQLEDINFSLHSNESKTKRSNNL